MKCEFVSLSDVVGEGVQEGGLSYQDASMMASSSRVCVRAWVHMNVCAHMTFSCVPMTVCACI